MKSPISSSELRPPSGPGRTVDLHAREVSRQVVTIEDVTFRRGPNRLSLEVVGKNERSRSFGFGIDYVAAQPSRN